MESSKQKNIEIFKYVADLITKQEFNDACMQFYAANVDKFEETEENKLEYSMIHESYVQILEQYIESKLFENHSQTDVENFYSDFISNHKQYQSINDIAFDIMFGFTDFQKFKTNMINFKKGSKNYDAQQAQKTSKENQSIFTKPHSYFYELEKESIGDSKFGWVKRHEIFAENKYDIVLHTRPVENTDFFMSRLEGVFKNISVKAMQMHWQNFNTTKDEMNEKLEILSYNDQGFAKEMYFKSRSSFMMSSRDGIIEFTSEVDKQGRAVTIMHTKERNDIPVPENTVRMDFWRGSMIQDRGNDCYYLFFEIMDLKGYVPKSLLNMGIGAGKTKEIQELYQKVKPYQDAL